ICIRWMYGLAATKPPKVVNSSPPRRGSHSSAPSSRDARATGAKPLAKKPARKHLTAEQSAKHSFRTYPGPKMRIYAAQYADQRGTSSPWRLHFDRRQVDVLETLDYWHAPDYRYIKGRGYDGGLFILRFDQPAEWGANDVHEPAAFGGCIVRNYNRASQSFL